MSIDELIRKKGNYEILKQLKIKGQNYNSIKQKLKENISARTLDYRLRKLMELGFLESTNIILDGSAKTKTKKKYFLTYKGLFLLTCFETLEYVIINNSILPQDYLKKFKSILLKNINLNFKRVWKQLKIQISKNNTIYTLKKKKPNKIVKFNDNGIIVETEKGKDFISYSKLEEAWAKFVKNGYLFHNNYIETSYRSSFMMALFSLLPYVKVNEGPPLQIKLEIGC